LDIGSTEIDQFATAAYRDEVGGESSDDRTVTVRLLGDHSLGRRGEVRTALTYADVNHDEVLDGSQKNAYRQRLWSMGAEAEWQIASNPELQGARPARFSVGFAIDGADTPESGDKPPLETLWDWGGRLGFTTFVGRQDLLLHGSVSRRTRFPALRELYSGALGRFIPNPDLEPEVLTGGEAGFTLMGEAFEIQAVAFYQVLADGIVRSSVSTPEGKKYKRINQDEIRSRGIELLASGKTGPVGWSGDFTLQKTRGFTPEGGEVKLEYEPEVAGKFSAYLPLPLSFDGRITGRFMGRQYCENPEVGGLVPFDSSRHVDLSVGRLFGLGRGPASRAEGMIHLDNATDAVVLDQCGLPQPGRTFRIQIRIW
jgi:iron complex outermembrane receptor protein